MIIIMIISQFTPLILSNDQTFSRLGLSELLVIMSKYDLDVNFQASDPHDKFFIERCVLSLDTLQPYGVRLTTVRRRTTILHYGSPINQHN